MNEQVLRIATIFILVGWRVYWEIMARRAQVVKPGGEKKTSLIYLIHKNALSFSGTILIFQLFGLQLFPAPVSYIGQLVGFSFVILGAFVSIYARKTLADNWSHAFDYQVKTKHELVTNGIYKYIRHPIYTGMIIGCVSAEIIARSYLFIPLFIFMFLWAYFQGKSEEKILVNHFGVQYEKYMKTTKMLIPYLL